MIRPQTNLYREAIDLSGVWRIRFDPDAEGLSNGWAADIGEGLAIAVPGSWNEQLAEAGYMNYVGAAWLQTDVLVPLRAEGKRRVLRFASADYEAEVYVNGQLVGRSGPLKLPFEVDITGYASPGGVARVVVRVSNALPEHGPMQAVTKADYLREGRRKDEYFPAVRFDFFPFGGLARPVHLVIAPNGGLAELQAGTEISGADGVVRLSARAGDETRMVRFRIAGHGCRVEADAEVRDGIAQASLTVEGCKFWSPESPALYQVHAEALDEAGAAFDAAALRVGVREVRIDGRQLLLNGRAITLRGFGKHEDSFIRGSGLDLPLLVRDFQLLKWLGANSVRTSHYPYAEEFYDFCDEQGVLVIDEVFSVNLDFRRTDARDMEAHKAAITALISRDRSRTCVIAWSLSNEPGYLGEAEYRERSGPYWREVFAHARALDPSRPLTHANVQYAGVDDPAFLESDIVTINRYHGWYTVPGQLDEAVSALRADFDVLRAHGKPIFVAEFGADAMAGMHATTDQLFTEEYQSDFIAAYWRAIEADEAVIGGHVWNFADFRTAQHARRVVYNLKGVFTRAREPKRAAFTLRRLWRGVDN